MSHTIRKVDYFSMTVADKPGEGVNALAALAGVNLLAFSGFPRGRKAQLDFVPEDTKAFKAAIKKAKLTLNPKKTAFLVQGDDAPGALVAAVDKLAEAGINVTALDGVSAGSGRFGAIFWVKPEKVAKAAKLLGAS